MDYTISTKTSRCTISDHGAELKSFVKDGAEYMWQADPAFWGRTAPVLFPFVGQVAGGLFRYENQEYPMGQHGFARDMDFVLVEQSENAISFVLKSNEETLKKYPLDFVLTISYELVENKLKVIWKVENPSDKPLHFSIGAHPGFNCTLNESMIVLLKDGVAIESFTNSIFGSGLMTHNTEIINVTDGTMELNEHSFDGDAFVIENSQVDEVQLWDKAGKEKVAVTFSAPLVGIWSPPKKNAPFMCIEPWYGRADKEGFDKDLSEREWGNTLASKEVFDVSYEIEVF